MREFQVKGEKKPLTAKFYGTQTKKMTIHNQEKNWMRFLQELENAAV